MGKWFLVAGLGVVAVGVLAFLRIVANALEVVEREAEGLRVRTLSRKRPAEENEVHVAQAA